MKNAVFMLGILAMLAAPTAALAKNDNANNNGNGGDNGNNNGFITKTVTVVTDSNVYMGMSNKTPPNEHAAASQGTRTEETSYKIDVYGPPGQVNAYEELGDSCANCSISEPYDEETVITDLPGANR